MRSFVIAGLTITTMLSGCAGPAVTSQRVTVEAASTPLEGLAYSLPKRDIVLTIIRCTAKDASAAEILTAQKRCVPPAVIADEGGVVSAPPDGSKNNGAGGSAAGKGATQPAPVAADAKASADKAAPKGDKPAKDKPATGPASGKTNIVTSSANTTTRSKPNNTFSTDIELERAPGNADAKAIMARYAAQQAKADSDAHPSDAAKKKAAETAKAKADAATERAKAAAAEVPQSASSSPGAPGCTFVYSYSISVMPFEADASALFVADFRHNDWRDDANMLEVSTNGLLTSANDDATGHVSDVIITLAGTVASLVTLAGGPPSPTFSGEIGKPKVQICDARNVMFRRRFDAWDGPQTINDLLQSSSLPFAIAVQRDPLRPAEPAKPADQASSADVADADPSYSRAKDMPEHPELIGGLYYRTVVPITVALFQCADAPCETIVGKPVEAAMALVPRRSPVFFVPMRASGFGKNTSKLAFDHGLLTSWNQTRPSKVLDVARIPGAVLDQVFSSIGHVIQLRVDTSTKEKSLGDARLQLLHQQADMAKIQACVVAAADHRDQAAGCFPAPAASTK